MQTDKTKESVVEFDKEMKDLAGAQADHRGRVRRGARQRRVRGYAQQFESLGRITGQIANLWVLGLPMTELQREYDATDEAHARPGAGGREEVRQAGQLRRCCSSATAPRSNPA